MLGVVGASVSRGLEVTESKEAFLELAGPSSPGVKGDGVTELNGLAARGMTLSGFHPEAMGSHRR